mmetsp:Transcript_7523/g.23773  ORF Transcript_7523/g.23773 Transcript_7523/m.23773 type:complete len:202 (+) Transcript_7523:2-607(+)
MGKGPPPPPPGAKGAAVAPLQQGGDATAGPDTAPPAKGKGKGKGGKGGPPPPPAAPAAAGQEAGAKGKGKGKGPGPKGGGAPPPKAAQATPLKHRAATVGLPNGSAPFHRKIYWKPLDLQCMEGTIFADGDADGELSKRVDTGALQRMFEGESAKLAAAAAKSSSLLKSVQGKAEGTKILSDNRARNIAIILKRLPKVRRS